MLTDTQIRLYQTVRTAVGLIRDRTLGADRDERGAIPAEVAWIAGLVVLAIVVLGIITLTTTNKASAIKLN